MQIQANIIQIVEAYVNKTHGTSYAITMPKVTFDIKGVTSGVAILRNHEVQFNLQIAIDNWPEFRQTIAHEVAHLVAYKINPCDRYHGRTWKSVMIMFGHEPRRCHDYVCQKAKNTKKFQYTCTPGCRFEHHHEIGLNRHRKFQAGTLSFFQCKSCGQKLTFVQQLT